MRYHARDANLLLSMLCGVGGSQNEGFFFNRRPFQVGLVENRWHWFCLVLSHSPRKYIFPKGHLLWMDEILHRLRSRGMLLAILLRRRDDHWRKPLRRDDIFHMGKVTLGQTWGLNGTLINPKR